jgi:hypothetical protein
MVKIYQRGVTWTCVVDLGIDPITKNGNRSQRAVLKLKEKHSLLLGNSKT